MSSAHSERSLFVKAVELYIYSSLHIGICAFSLTYFAFAILDIPFDLAYGLFILFATVCLYSLHRIVGIHKTAAFSASGRYAIIRQYRRHIFIYFVISGLLSLYYFIQLTGHQKLYVVIPCIISLLYTVPVVRNKRVRDVHYLKIFLIAGVWSALCLVPPGFVVKDPVYTASIFTAGVLFFIGITIPFDVRDMEVDASIGVQTLPMLLGPKRAFSLAIVCCLASLVPVLFLSFSRISPIGFWAWVTGIMISIGILSIYKPKYGDWYFSLILDGTIGIFAPLYMIYDRIFQQFL